MDPTPLYHDLQANYHSPDHSDNPDHAQDGNAGGKGGQSKAKGGLRSRGQAREDNRSWQQKCKDLLRSIFEMKDSMPFRYTVVFSCAASKKIIYGFYAGLCIQQRDSGIC